ncbi:M48 family metallopeptidase [Candidatus Woesearchaeota archaeon]|nr:M48 family metallopeptidase [Candidatus Woesearchaeota archaeon]
MDLYHTFLKKLGDYQTGSGGHIADEELQVSFDKVNAEYFDDYMLAPNITWGGDSIQHLGHYSFTDDTITMSKSMSGAGELLDYVMYHELLHKKHKFEHKNGRTRSHTKAFRTDERKFKINNGEEAEKALTKYLQGLGRRPRKKSVRKNKIRNKSAIQKILDFF